MRNMSFAMTTRQIREGSKTVTRRFGWWFLRRGDLVCPVEKAMGLKKGEKVKPIRGPLHIISSWAEPLGSITKKECILEGFPECTPYDFVFMLTSHYGCKPDEMVNRIEFEYTD